jgi:hypothetical protein
MLWAFPNLYKFVVWHQTGFLATLSGLPWNFKGIIENKMAFFENKR